jgi:hypothetical protein
MPRKSKSKSASPKKSRSPGVALNRWNAFRAKHTGKTIAQIRTLYQATPAYIKAHGAMPATKAKSRSKSRSPRSPRKPKGSSAQRRAAANNPWLKYVAAYRKKHGNTIMLSKIKTAYWASKGGKSKSPSKKGKKSPKTKKSKSKSK